MKISGPATIVIREGGHLVTTEAQHVDFLGGEHYPKFGYFSCLHKWKMRNNDDAMVCETCGREEQR